MRNPASLLTLEMRLHVRDRHATASGDAFEGGAVLNSIVRMNAQELSIPQREFLTKQRQRLVVMLFSQIREHIETFEFAHRLQGVLCGFRRCCAGSVRHEKSLPEGLDSGQAIALNNGDASNGCAFSDDSADLGRVPEQRRCLESTPDLGSPFCRAPELFRPLGFLFALRSPRHDYAP